MLPWLGDGINDILSFPQTSFCLQNFEIQGLPSLLVVDPKMLACCLWPDTQLYTTLMQRNREQAAEIYLSKWLTMIPASVFTVTAYVSFGLTYSRCQAPFFPIFSVQNSLETQCPGKYLDVALTWFMQYSFAQSWSMAACAADTHCPNCIECSSRHTA